MVEERQGKIRWLRPEYQCPQGPATAEQVARSFKSARTDRVTDLLDTLVSLGQCRALEDGRYVA